MIRAAAQVTVSGSSSSGQHAAIAAGVISVSVHSVSVLA